MSLDPTWIDLYRRLASAELESLIHDPEAFLKKAGEIMDSVTRGPGPIQSWRSMRMKLDGDDDLILSVQVTEHSGNRLNSPREVRMVFTVGDLSSEMLTVRDVMDS
jgi:hypothetical protein